MQIQVPQGVSPGAMLGVTAPDGTRLQVQVPVDLTPDGTFYVDVPPAVEGVPMGAPVEQPGSLYPPAAPVNMAVATPIAPHNDSIVRTDQVLVKSDDSPLQDTIDITQLVLFGACGCCHSSLLPSKGALGIASKAVLCCVELECCAKHGMTPLPCYCCALHSVPVTTCVKAHCQTCCLVQSAAFPPDTEVPFAIAGCFWVCLPSCGCYQQVGSLYPHGGNGVW